MLNILSRRSFHRLAMLSLPALWWFPMRVSAQTSTAPRESTTVPSDSNNKAHPEWNEQCRARVNAALGTPVGLLFIGDSITQNWTDPDWGGERRGRRIWQQYYADKHALDFGVGADKTQNVLWRMDTMGIRALHPRVAVVLIGTNNEDDTPQQIADGTRAILDKTRRFYPGIRIILVSILPNRRAYQKMRDVNVLTRQFADNTSIFYLDLASLFVPDDDNWIGIGMDHLHPNETGYAIWAKAMQPLLDRLLASDPKH